MIAMCLFLILLVLLGYKGLAKGIFLFGVIGIILLVVLLAFVGK